MKNILLTIPLFLGIFTLANAQQAGTLDPTFGTAGIITTSIGPNNETAHAIAVQADGKMVVAGETYNNSSVVEDFALARYNSDGSLDNTFGTNGFVVTDLQQSTDVVKAIAIQPDGKIVVAGHSDNTFNYDFAVARYLANGTLDNSFGTNGKAIKNFGSTDFGLAMALLPNGKILVSGRAYNGQNGDFALIQLNPNGTFDNNFGTAGAIMADLFGEDESANAIAVQADGKIVLAGDRYANNVSQFALARFNPAGSLDPSFSFDGKLSTNIGGLSDVIYAVGIQSNGSIVAAGVSNNISISDFALARYLSDGTPDNSFSGDGQLTTNVATGGDYASSIAIQSDGKILVGGTATGSNSISDFAVVRYLSDGNLDASFGNGGIGLADFATGRDVANAMVLHQGKIVMAGASDKNSQTSFAVARFLIGSSVAVEDILSDSPGFELFPNPANELLQIKLDAEVSGSIRVVSATGQKMIEMPIHAENIQVNISSWPAGMYFVERIDDKRLWPSQKLLISRR